MCLHLIKIHLYGTISTIHIQESYYTYSSELSIEKYIETNQSLSSRVHYIVRAIDKNAMKQSHIFSAMKKAQNITGIRIMEYEYIIIIIPTIPWAIFII